MALPGFMVTWEKSQSRRVAKADIGDLIPSVADWYDESKEQWVERPAIYQVLCIHGDYVDCRWAGWIEI